MEVEFAAINQWIASYFLPFCRFGGLFIAMIVIGSRTVNTRTRLILALSVSVCSAPLIQPTVAIDLFSLEVVVQAVVQTLIGVGIGFITRVVFETFVIAGQVVAMQTGLGFASLIDQSTGVSVPTLGQMFVMMATLIFLSIDGHLSMINIVVTSFETLPINESGMFFVQLDKLIYWAQLMFTTGFMMVLSAIVALLVMNLSLGVMTRSAPQLNIFAVGFPIMTVVGMTIIWLLLKSFLPHFIDQIQRGETLACELIMVEC
ncbi:MAG: flagellar biosynthetic protein FliR [Gammaproteobacteria bacterium]|nr:flagellar biosynthetic protein FliR [Gammaproteobacteria bacterium]